MLELAAGLLEAGSGGLEALRVHQFTNDEEAHDDDAIDKLYAVFSAEFDRDVSSLSKRYGKPVRRGEEHDDVIPLNGVFRSAVWSIEDQQLYLAASHEDRGCPILLILGTGE